MGVPGQGPGPESKRTREVRVFGAGSFVPTKFVGLADGREFGVLPARRVPSGKRIRLEELVKGCNSPGLTVREMESLLVEGIGILVPDTAGVDLLDACGVDDLLEMFVYAVSAYSGAPLPPAEGVPGAEAPPPAAGSEVSPGESGRSSGTA